jgi:hypothetical protein
LEQLIIFINFLSKSLKIKPVGLQFLLFIAVPDGGIDIIGNSISVIIFLNPQQTVDFHLVCWWIMKA